MTEFTFKVIVIGNSKVGKTSFIRRYVNDKFERNYKATIGVDFALKKIKWSSDTTIKLQFWDIAGQERFTSMTRAYYQGANACLLMFDVTEEKSFHKVASWKKDLDDKCALKDGSPIPCLLLANKCDLVDEVKVSSEEIEDLSLEHDFLGWSEISVKDGTMIDECVNFLISQMAKSKDLRDFQDSLQSDAVKVSRKEVNAKSWKCPC